jgi:hypothetical protein
VIERLEIQPELRTGAEEVAEPQGGIAGDDALLQRRQFLGEVVAG